MELKGKIIAVLPLQSGIGRQSGKEWKQQEYVIETLDQYPKKVCYLVWGDNVERCRAEIGEVVTVHFDLESTEYKGRWYSSVKAWRVDKAQQAVIAPAPHLGSAPTPPPTYDDLPF